LEGAGFAPTTFQAFELIVALTSINNFQLIVSVFLNSDSEGVQAIPNNPPPADCQVNLNYDF
jgi:hypothetical protein